MPYGVLNDPKDVAQLINLRGVFDHVPQETWRKIDNFLQTRAKRAVAAIRGILGAKLGRPPDLRKGILWSLGADLRRARYSWEKITRELDPKGYKKDRKYAMDRMRLGVTKVLRGK